MATRNQEKHVKQSISHMGQMYYIKVTELDRYTKVLALKLEISFHSTFLTITYNIYILIQPQQLNHPSKLTTFHINVLVLITL